MNRRHMLRSRYHFFYNFVSERRDSLTRNSRSDILLVLFYLIGKLIVSFTWNTGSFHRIRLSVCTKVGICVR